MLGLVPRLPYQDLLAVCVSASLLIVLAPWHVFMKAHVRRRNGMRAQCDEAPAAVAISLSERSWRLNVPSVARVYIMVRCRFAARVYPGHIVLPFGGHGDQGHEGRER